MRRINDLKGGEWMLASKSVWKRSFGVGKGEHKIRRKTNPTCKPIDLCADFVKALSCKGEIVVDPFAGTGGVVLGAQKIGRKAVGAELDAEQIEAYQKCSGLLSTLFRTYDPLAIKHGDYRDVFPSSPDNEPWADLVLTDPQWFDLDRRRKSSRYQKGKGNQERPMAAYKEAPVFKTLDDWAEYMRVFAVWASNVLKKGRYLAYFMEDAYLDGEYTFLSEISKNAVKSVGFVPQGEWIWYNEARRACIFGYPSRMITSRTHTKVLFFTNGKLEDQDG